MSSEGFTGRNRTPEKNLVYEAPPSIKVSGNDLRPGMTLVDSRRVIKKKIPHGSDEVLVVLDDNSSRTFSSTKPEVDVFE